MNNASDTQAKRIRHLESDLRFPAKDLHSFTASAADDYIAELEMALSFIEKALAPLYDATRTGQVTEW